MRAFWAIVLCLLSTAAFAQTPSADVSAQIKDPVLHPGEKTVVEITVKVHDGLHAQSRKPLDPNFIKFDVDAKADGGVVVGPVEYPPGKVKDFGALGMLSVYEGSVVFKVPLSVPADAKPGPVKVTAAIEFQACDDSACFMPEHPNVELNAVIARPGETAVAAPIQTTRPTTTAAASTPPARQPRPKKEATVLGLNLTKGGVPLGLAAAFVVGIIFNAMPCVLPVMPLKIIGFYEASHHDRRRSLTLGAAFSVGVVGSFALLGLLVVVLHVIKWGELFQNIWFTVGIVVLLAAMAANSFGWFEIQLPSSMYGFSPRHDTVFGNVLFGVLTAGLSTPCTFGMFVAVLTWLLTQPPAVGVLVMSTVGLGMASPYLILSGLPELARRFPRTGPWAGVVKQFMGFLLLATAVYFAQPFFYRVNLVRLSWWLVFAVIAASGVFLIVRGLQFGRTYRATVTTILMAILVTAPALWVVRRLTAEPFEWFDFSDARIADARAAGRPVVIDFTAAWCPNCHALEATTLHDLAVFNAVKRTNALMVKGDVTTKTTPASPLLGKLDPYRAIPLTAVYLPDETDPVLLDGIYSADDLIDALAGK